LGAEFYDAVSRHRRGYGFSAEATAKAVAACETLIYAVALAREAKTFSRACTSFHDAALKSKDKTPLTVPVFVAPAPPAARNRQAGSAPLPAGLYAQGRAGR